MINFLKKIFIVYAVGFIMGASGCDILPPKGLSVEDCYTWCLNKICKTEKEMKICIETLADRAIWYKVNRNPKDKTQKTINKCLDGCKEYERP